MKTVPAPTDNTTDERQQQLADEQAAGLRALADLVQANPAIGDELSFSLRHISEPVDTREIIAAFAQAAARSGLKVDKRISAVHAGVEVWFSPQVRVQMWADRAEVCERIVTGTETITTEIPDPEALAAVPKITVTETVEQVEWRCGPLLAPAEDADR